MTIWNIIYFNLLNSLISAPWFEVYQKVNWFDIILSVLSILLLHCFFLFLYLSLYFPHTHTLSLSLSLSLSLFHYLSLSSPYFCHSLSVKVSLFSSFLFSSLPSTLFHCLFLLCLYSTFFFFSLLLSTFFSFVISISVSFSRSSPLSSLSFPSLLFLKLYLTCW